MNIFILFLFEYLLINLELLLLKSRINNFILLSHTPKVQSTRYKPAIGYNFLRER